MSAFIGGIAALPANIGEITDVSLRFPCNDFGNEQIDSYTMPGHAFAQCPSLDGGVIFTSLSSNFTYNEFPSISFDDFPVESFAPSDAINTDQNWMVSPEGMIVYFVKMVGPDKVEVGVSGTTNMTYAGIATIKAGETAWTIATFQELASTQWRTDEQSLYLKAVVRDNTPLVYHHRDGLFLIEALGRDGSILWTNEEFSSYPLLINGANSTVVGERLEVDGRNWVFGFLDPLTGKYDTVDPSYQRGGYQGQGILSSPSDPGYDSLVAFEEYEISNGQVLMYDNPGVFGVDIDFGYERLAESSRLIPGDEGTWRRHVECDSNPYENFDCTRALETYITPSGKKFDWDRVLKATVGDNALFVGGDTFFIIGPDGGEVTQGENSSMAFTSALSMDDKNLLLTDGSGRWSVIRVS